MPKKKNNKKTTKKIYNTSSKEARFLETLIKLSKGAITNQGTGVDKFFEEQVIKLQKKLNEVKK